MITRHDNGDGTTTFTGVPVTIPTSVAERFDVVEVRRPTTDDFVEAYGGACKPEKAQRSASVILAPRPTWKPPASLAPGEYLVQRGTLRTAELTLAGRGAIRQIFRDFTPPTIEGRWRVNQDGTATYLGDK